MLILCLGEIKRVLIYTEYTLQLRTYSYLFNSSASGYFIYQRRKLRPWKVDGHPWVSQVVSGGDEVYHLSFQGCADFTPLLCPLQLLGVDRHLNLSWLWKEGETN